MMYGQTNIKIFFRLTMDSVRWGIVSFYRMAGLLEWSSENFVFWISCQWLHSI